MDIFWIIWFACGILVSIGYIINCIRKGKINTTNIFVALLSIIMGSLSVVYCISIVIGELLYNPKIIWKRKDV